MVPLDPSARSRGTRAGPVAVVLAVVGGVVLVGCGSSGPSEAQLDRFEGVLAGLRADNAALVERIQALEIRGAKSADRPVFDRRQGDRPALEVVRLVPASPAEDLPDAAEPSPERDALAKAEFARGESLLSSKKYDAALNAFAGFVVRFPEHPRAAEATLRRGECYFHKGELDRAAEQLEAALAQSPDVAGASKALTLLADAYQRSGDTTSADRTKKRLPREPPTASSGGARPTSDAAAKPDPREGPR